MGNKLNKWTLGACFILVVLAFLGTSVTRKRVSLPPKQAPTSTIVKFEDEATKQEFLEENNLSPVDLKPTHSGDYVVPKKPTEIKLSDGTQTYPNFEYKALLTPNDPLGIQWYTSKISAPQAWDITTGSSSITVAVIDTGFALGHEDMSGRWAENNGEVGIVSTPSPNLCLAGSDKKTNNCDDDGNGKIDDWRGWDFVNNDNDPQPGLAAPTGCDGNDYRHHGTITSGLVGATGNNNKGTASINWGARILPLQVLADNGCGSGSSVADAIDYAVAQGAKVISLSLGQPDYDQYMRDRINAAISAGAIVIAAAGNSGTPSCGCMAYPGNFPEVVAVGATDWNDTKASFSSYGPNLDIMAPGSSNTNNPLHSTYWSSTNQTSAYTNYANGTSIATPIVAGLAALLKDQFPAATPADLERYLKEGADKVPGMNGQTRTDQYGYGRINARGALRNFTWAIDSQAAYTDQTKASSSNLASLSPGQTAWLVLKVKNIGTETWYKDGGGPNPIHLGTESPQDRLSRYADPTWLGPSRPAGLQEATVAPDGIGTFEFAIKVPHDGGIFIERFNLVAEGLKWMKDTGLSFYTQVHQDYRWQLIGQAAQVSASDATAVDLTNLSPNQTVYLKVTAKNLGASTWYKTGGYQVHLGTSNPQDRSSPFCATGWLGCNRSAEMSDAVVSTNGQTTFGFYYKAPATKGTYREYFNPVAEGITWMNDPGMNFYTVVNTDYRWQFIGQAANKDLTNLTLGETATITLTAKNIGESTWYQAGAFPVRVGTVAPQDRSSTFASGWIGANRPTGLAVTEIKKNETATFTWTIKANSTGTFYERFSLLAEAITWMNDPGISYYIVVQ